MSFSASEANRSKSRLYFSTMAVSFVMARTAIPRSRENMSEVSIVSCALPSSFLAEEFTAVFRSALRLLIEVSDEYAKPKVSASMMPKLIINFLPTVNCDFMKTFLPFNLLLLLIA